MGGGGPVLEHMAEMASAAAAMRLDANHPVAGILRGVDGTGLGIVEARPAGAAFELGLRPEQRLSASGATEGAGALLEIQRATAGRFGAVLAHDLVLFGREQTAPFRIGMGDREPLCFHGVALQDDAQAPRQISAARGRGASASCAGRYSPRPWLLLFGAR